MHAADLSHCSVCQSVCVSVQQNVLTLNWTVLATSIITDMYNACSVILVSLVADRLTE